MSFTHIFFLLVKTLSQTHFCYYMTLFPLCFSIVKLVHLAGLFILKGSDTSIIWNRHTNAYHQKQLEVSVLRSAEKPFSPLIYISIICVV